eukprot:Phypoly_transcript_04544.p1 GENE.Phypoly_transcript_04544~~Phypoly_transcript_04544.p1  ORF type:complete len:680 (+),score=116.58 Phypoly_transcript_04544:85-2124(+)
MGEQGVKEKELQDVSQFGQGSSKVDFEDEHWKSMSTHFTVRSVVVGVVVGGLMSFTNMYFGLQTGWITMGSLQSTVLGFLFFRLVQKFMDKHHIGYTPFTYLENVLLQTTAVATATMPLAGGYVGIVPALATLGHPVSYWHLIFWSLGVAFFGVFFAVPLRAQTILREKLRFPSGTATAQMIRMLHKMDNVREEEEEGEESEASPENPPTKPTTFSASASASTDVVVRSDEERNKEDDKDWDRKVRYLLLAFFASAIIDLLEYFFPIVAAVPLFTYFRLPGVTAFSWVLTPSLSYVGQGMIMGPKTGLSMMIGAIVGWGILGPIARHKGWAPGSVGSWESGAKGWVMWVALAIMLGESLSSLAIIAIKAIRSYKNTWKAMKESKKEGREMEGELEQLDPVPEEHRVPKVWWLSGLFASAVLCVAVTSPMFHMKVYEPIVAIVVACLTSVLAVRALGETDLNPVSGIGKLSQIVFAGVAPHNMVSNLIAGAISEAGAMQAGDMMQDLKTGHLLRASPRAQFFAQLIGSFFSVFFALVAYILYSNAYSIPSKQLPAPTAGIWIDMAKLMDGGHLPENAAYFCLAFAILAALFPIVETLYPKSKKYLPSCIAFAVAMYNTPNWTIPRAVGSLIVFLWTRYSPESQKKYMIIVASGLVLGDGITSIITAIFASTHVPIYKSAV